MFNIFKNKKELILKNQIKDLEDKIKNLEKDYRTGFWEKQAYQKVKKDIKDLHLKFNNQKILIRALWEEKGIDKRYNKLIEDYKRKGQLYTDYYSKYFIQEIAEEILLMLDESEKENEIIKVQLNLQVLTNNLLNKEIEELKKINNRT